MVLSSTKILTAVPFVQACALYAAFVEYSTAKAHGPASGRLLLPTLTAVHDGDLPTLAQMEVPLLSTQALEGP